MYVSRLREALRFGCGVARNSGWSGITSQRTGLFYLGGPGSPHQQGWGPCSGLLSQLLLGAMVVKTLILNAKAVGTVPMTRHGAECTMLPMLLTQ